jgi:uncharacterized radical SAM superfamily Fe-S cluster-containing enzyme
VMLNTNGKRIATDDRFLAELSEVCPNIYFHFDGFDTETYRIIRGEPDILPKKLRALDRLTEIDCTVILVPAIERGVNEHEIGKIIRFGLDHPAVKGINFQAAFHAGRHELHDPMQRMTNPISSSSSKSRPRARSGPPTSFRCRAASRPAIR